MSGKINENLEYLKAQLSTEEQFLENAIRSEKFIKRHLTKFIVIALILIGVGVYFGVQKSAQEAKFERANEAFNTLLQKPADEAARAILRENNADLYALFALGTRDPKLLSDALSLQTDPLLKQMLNISNGGQSAELLGNFNAFMNGFEAIKVANFALADAEFQKIEPNSNLTILATQLRHIVTPLKLNKD